MPATIPMSSSPPSPNRFSDRFSGELKRGARRAFACVCGADAGGARQLAGHGELGAVAVHGRAAEGGQPDGRWGALQAQEPFAPPGFRRGIAIRGDLFHLGRLARGGVRGEREAASRCIRAGRSVAESASS